MDNLITIRTALTNYLDKYINVNNVPELHNYLNRVVTQPNCTIHIDAYLEYFYYKQAYIYDGENRTKEQIYEEYLKWCKGSQFVPCSMEQFIEICGDRITAHLR